MSRIKKNNAELKASRPTLEEVKFIPRIPLSILVENVRSVHNVGAIFRSADGFGAEKIFLTGYTAYPPREDLHKTALGAEKSVPWEYSPDPMETAKQLQARGITLAALEQTSDARSIYLTDWVFPLCLMVGNEVTGISDELVKLADLAVEIPMQGIKQSLNVSVAAGVAGYEIARNYYRQKELQF